MTTVGKMALGLLTSVLAAAVLADSAPRTSPETPLNNHNNELYTVTAYIGSPPQPFELLLDINSPYIQVDAKVCKMCTSSNRFASNTSSTYHWERDVQSEMAELGQDSVVFGPRKEIGVANQTILARKSPTSTSYRDMDGLLVLLMQGLNSEVPSNSQSSLLEALQKSGEIGALVYSLYLNKESLGWVAAENSTLAFGTSNLSRFSQASDFTYVPASLTDASWRVAITSVRLGREKLGSGGQTALISTTQSRLIVPSEVYDAMYGAICNSWFRTCLTRSREILWNCTETPQSRFNPLTFSLGDLEVTFPAQEYTRHSTSDYCSLHFEAGDHWVLGTAFLTKYYTLFDLGGRRLGFAVARHESEMAVWLVVLLIAVAVVFCGGAVIGGIYAVKKRRTKQEFVELKKFSH